MADFGWKAFLMSALLWPCGPARNTHAQTAGSGDRLQATLDRLAAASDDLQKRLPNFVCKETFVSQELRGGKVKNEVHAAGDLRIERGLDGKLVEQFHPSERNGKPVHDEKLKLPVFLTGGFKDVLEYFEPATQACWRFGLAGERIEFENAPDAPGTLCSRKAGVRGFGLLDPDGNIAHLERRVDAATALERKAAPFVAVDLKRVELGGTEFSLSSHVRAENAKDNSTFHWEANYSECRLFHVSVTLSPASESVSEPKP